MSPNRPSLPSAGWPRRETPRRRPRSASGTRTVVMWCRTTPLPCPGSGERPTKAMPPDRLPSAHVRPEASGWRRTTRKPSGGSAVRPTRDTPPRRTTSAPCTTPVAGCSETLRKLSGGSAVQTDQGDAFAQRSLGVMYREGRGVSRDDREAVRCFVARPTRATPSGRPNSAGWLRRGSEPRVGQIRRASVNREHRRPSRRCRKMGAIRAVRPLVVAALVPVVLAVPAVVRADGRVALVVGNSTYAHIGGCRTRTTTRPTCPRRCVVSGSR